jgi:hypothetical protein
MSQTDLKLDSLADMSTLQSQLEWDSSGTLSEADEHDMTCLINDDCNNLFDTIKKKNKEKHSDHHHHVRLPRFGALNISKKSPPGLKKQLTVKKKESDSKNLVLNSFQNEFNQNFKLLSKEIQESKVHADECPHSHSKENDAAKRARAHHDHASEGALAAKIRHKWRNMMIVPTNRKLVNFHLVVASVFFVDFFLTGFILGNYEMLRGDESQKDFLNHNFVYTVIIFVQFSDIVLNFFKIQRLETKDISEPTEVAKMYLKGTFIPDCVAAFPYSVTYPPLIALRYLKLLKIGEYKAYFHNFLYDMFQNLISKEKLSNLIDMNGLVTLLVFTSHMFAVIWMLLGRHGLALGEADGGPRGWIHEAGLAVGQATDYWSVYIISVYFVITSFTSIGYGDIKAHAPDEHLFLILLMMVGIGFYGYMIGTIQKLIAASQARDLFAELTQSLDNWLIKLGKVKAGARLNSSVIRGTRKFFADQFRLDAMMVCETDFFKRLKPRLQNEVLDCIYR